jgi:hypothetical protein
VPEEIIILGGAVKKIDKEVPLRSMRAVVDFEPAEPEDDNAYLPPLKCINHFVNIMPMRIYIEVPLFLV